MNTLRSTFCPAYWPLLVPGLLLFLSLTSPGQSTLSERHAGVPLPEDAPKLIGILERADSSAFEKARACQQLGIVGSATAVGALSGLLDHPQLAAFARCGLEGIRDPAAEEALRRALNTLQGKYLVGAVNSLGVRRDPKSVVGLIPLVRDPSKGAAPAALLALARISSPEATSLLRETIASGPPDLRQSAAEGCLICAEKLSAGGKREEALALYEAVRKADVTLPLRLAAVRGAILAREGDAIPLVLEQLRSPDPAFRDIAIRAAQEIPGPAVTHALAGELGQATPNVQVLILQALADRGDRSARGPIEALADADSPEVRLGSLQALGTIGDSSSVPILLRSMASGRTPAESDAAAASLVRLTASDANEAILKAMSSAAPELRAQLITVLGHRHATEATGELLKQAGDPDVAVSKAAFDALAAVAGTGDLQRVIRVTLNCKDPGVREKAEHALYTVSLKNPEVARRGEPLAMAYRQTTDPGGQCSLMQVLAMLGDATAYSVISSAYDTSVPQVRETALRLLVQWPDATPAPLLLRIFKQTTNDLHRTLALRAVVTQATLWADESNRPAASDKRPPREAVEWLTAANAAIRDQVEEKRMILSGLGDLNCVEGLRLLQPYVEDPSVKKEAAMAALRAVKGLSSSEEKALARTLLEKVMATNQDADLQRQAREAMRAL